MDTSVFRILVIDDSPVDRQLLCSILENAGHQVTSADDGDKGLACFSQEQPEIVLCDAIMPGKSGYDTVLELRNLQSHFVPVLFLTSMSEIEELTRHLHVAEDVVTKPYHREVLLAKIQSIGNVYKLHQAVLEQNDMLAIFNKQTADEQEIAKKIFDEILSPYSLNEKNFRYHISPSALFCGDVVMAARNSIGVLHIFLGDITGHGLAAAIGILPIKDTFYSMVRSGSEPYKILKEINKKLCQILPTDIFCAANYLVIDESSMTGQLFNGGMPSAWIFSHSAGEPHQEYKSNYVPLGIIQNQNYDQLFEELTFKNDDRILLFSDGITEMADNEGELFGSKVLKPLFADLVDSSIVFDQVLQKAAEYNYTDNLMDDCTMIEYVVSDCSSTHAHLDASVLAWYQGKMSWELSLELKAEALKHFDPLPLLGQIIRACPALEPRMSELQTILSELYANALEHGLLDLDSALKSDPAGMIEYYQLKADRLAILEEGHINFVVSHHKHPTASHGGKLVLQVLDSGDGFDYNQYKAKQAEQTLLALSGRGITLIQSLSAMVEYKGKGNCVEVTYLWE